MIKKVLSFIFYSFLSIGSNAVAQTAAILPQGYTQYFDNNGNPLTSGKVYNYIVGTTTFKNTWQDSGETILNTNPVTLDAAGRAKILGQGSYRQIVKKSNGDTVWDAVTASTGSGGGSSTTGDGDVVGTIKPWAGIIAPSQYAFAYGQEVSRTTYSTLLTAITQTINNIVCTSSSTTLTGLSDTTQINIGANVEISCMPAGTTVISKTSSTVTLSNPATISTTVTGVFFPFGNGDGSTTFNLPDLRGRAVAGRDNMGGVAASRLTSSFFATPGQGAASGSQFQQITISTPNLPSITLTTTIASGQGSHTHSLSANNAVAASNGNQGSGASGAITTPATITISAATLPAMTGTTPLGGSETAMTFGIVQPTMTINYIIKVTPDTSSSVATGVTDIQGMVGSISCGSGLLCTGNIINLALGINPVGGPISSTDNAVARFDGTTGNLIQNSLYTTIADDGTVSIAGAGTGIMKISQLPSFTSFTGLFPWAAPAAQTYAILGELGGVDLFINRPLTGAIHFRENGGADQITVATGGLLTTTAGITNTPGYVIPVTVLGTPGTALVAYSSQGTTATNGTSEANAVFSMTANKTGDKLPFYSEIKLDNGSVQGWAGNLVTLISPGNASLTGAWITEFDINNTNVDAGNSIGSLGTPVYWGINITGASTKNLTAAIGIDQVSVARWNRGIYFSNTSTIQADVETYSTATSSYVDRGTHASYTFDLNNATNALGWARAANNSSLLQRNAANAADISILKLDSSNVLNLYSTALTITSGANLALTTANAKLGAADASSPVAQSLSVQNVVAGVSNISGTNFTIKGSQSTGTSVGGDVLVQMSPSSTISATTVNSLLTAFRATSFSGNATAWFRAEGSGSGGYTWIGQDPGATNYTGFWALPSGTNPTSSNYLLVTRNDATDPAVYWNAFNSSGQHIFTAGGTLTPKFTIGTDATVISGDVVASNIGKTLVLRRGTNGSVGTFTCISASNVTISNTNVSTSDFIGISYSSGTAATPAPNINALTNATSFRVACPSGDTAVYNYAIIKNSP